MKAAKVRRYVVTPNTPQTTMAQERLEAMSKEIVRIGRKLRITTSGDHGTALERIHRALGRPLPRTTSEARETQDTLRGWLQAKEDEAILKRFDKGVKPKNITEERRLDRLLREAYTA